MKSEGKRTEWNKILNDLQWMLKRRKMKDLECGNVVHMFEGQTQGNWGHQRQSLPFKVVIREVWARFFKFIRCTNPLRWLAELFQLLLVSTIFRTDGFFFARTGLPHEGLGDSLFVCFFFLFH